MTRLPVRCLSEQCRDPHLKGCRPDALEGRQRLCRLEEADALDHYLSDVMVGSRVSIRHVHTQGGYLHSHPSAYPGGSQRKLSDVELVGDPFVERPKS